MMRRLGLAPQQPHVTVRGCQEDRMVRRLAIGLGAALFTLAAAGVLLAGPLTARPAVAFMPAFAAELPSVLLDLAR